MKVVKGDGFRNGQLFKMAKLTTDYDEWYKLLKANKEPEKEIADLINVAKENTYDEDKIFKAVNVVYDEEKELVEMYKVPKILCEKPFTHVETKRSIDWIDFTCLILNCIEWDEDMGFTTEKSYHDGSCFDEDNEEKLIKYAFSEDEIWDMLFEVTGTEDYDDLEEKFESCSWEDNENTCIVKIAGVEYAILRM